MVNCRNCENKHTCIDIYKSVGPCDVLFVQDCFKTRTGVNGFLPENVRILKKQFKFSSNSYSVNYINLVNRFLGPGKHPIKKDILECIEFVESIIDKCKPKFIIPMGSVVFYALTGKSGFKSWVGRKININEINVIPIYHPDYAAKSKQRQREYNAQIQNAAKQIYDDDSEVYKGKYKLITDHNDIIACLKYLSYQIDKAQAFDYETTHLIPAKGYPICLSIAYEIGKSVCLYWFDKEEFIKTRKFNIPENIKCAIKKWMLSDVKKIAQNAKFEIKWTKRHFGCEPANIVWDTKQAAHLLDENSQRKLSDLAYQYTDMGGYDIPMQEFLDKGHEHWEADPEFMLPYSAGDSDCTLQIYFKQKEQLESDTGLRWLFNNITLPAVTTLARIEERGIKIDENKIAEVEINLDKKIIEIKNKIKNYSEVKKTLEHFNKDKKPNKKLTEINLNSSIQVQYLLYKACKLPVLKRSKKSNEPSTDIDTIQQLKKEHPLVEDIMNLRSFAYQLTDLETIRIKMVDGVVFSDLIQDFVVSGRLSSRNPNLQNIKGGTDEEPSLIKTCFISRFINGVLTQADYNQLELRLIGSESREPKFKEAFENDIDLHSVTGSDQFDIPLEEFLKHKSGKYKDLRTEAKRINFGCQYNITEFGLSKKLGCTEDEARAKLNKWWSSYFNIKIWDKKNQKQVTRDLLTRSTIGRIRHLPEVVSLNKWARESALRQTSNFKIQSLGADITMWALVTVDKILTERKLQSFVIMQVHDSIVVDTHPDEKQEVRKILHDVMVEKANALFSFLWIPVKIDIEEGSNWNDTHKIDLKEVK